MPKNFALFNYYNASEDEITEFLNTYSLEEIKYHISILTNITDFNNFFHNMYRVNYEYVGDNKKLRYMNIYYNKLIKKAINEIIT